MNELSWQKVFRAVNFMCQERHIGHTIRPALYSFAFILSNTMLYVTYMLVVISQQYNCYVTHVLCNTCNIVFAGYVFRILTINAIRSSHSVISHCKLTMQIKYVNPIKNLYENIYKYM